MFTEALNHLTNAPIRCERILGHPLGWRALTQYVHHHELTSVLILVSSNCKITWYSWNEKK